MSEFLIILGILILIPALIGLFRGHFSILKSRGRSAIALLSALILMGSGAAMNPFPSSTPPPTESPEQFKAAAASIPFDRLAREAESLKGSKVHISGQVIQVLEGTPTILRVDTADYNISPEEAMKPDFEVPTPQIVLVVRKDNAGRVLEGDKVEIWGIHDGLASYVPWTGSKITLPQVTAYYLEIKPKGS
ncbi:MAG: hypothetical protein H5U02_00580 [Clostridia bacterium]|nr:hypothetical protein [Clostridia bacterium]